MLPPAAADRARRLGPMAIVVGPFLLAAAGFGYLIGRSVADAQRVGEMTAVFGALQGLGVVAGAVILLAGGGLVAALVHRGVTPAIWVAFGMAGCVVLGFLLALGTGSATRGPEPVPDVLRAGGTGGLQLEAAGIDFVAEPDAQIMCVADAGTTRLNTVSSLSLGKLQSVTLRGMLGRGAESSYARLTLFLNLDELPSGVTPPFWEGTVEVPGNPGAASSGAVAFTVTRQASGDTSAWPVTLRGTLRWACDDWSEPAGTGMGTAGGDAWPRQLAASQPST